MNIISFNMIIDLNKLLQDKHLNFKIHLKDACGCQSMWIEPLENQAISDEVYELINKYFENQRMTLEFSEDRINFWVANQNKKNACDISCLF